MASPAASSPPPTAPPGKVVVVGQGYVGLPLAMEAVGAGYDVVGLEVDDDRLTALAGGRSHVEDVGDGAIEDAIKTGRYLSTKVVAHAKEFDVAVITVPTPLREGIPDLSFIEGAAYQLAPLVRPGVTVVLESTTYPGTTEELLAPVLEAGSGLRAGADFRLGYSPERIDPGNRRWGLVNTPKVVSGIDAASLDAVKGFYDTIVDRTIAVSSPKVAEMTKLLENTFRHVNIALVNEMAMFASALGVDIWEAISAASTKPFGYLPFTPGPGVGGHCLPVDPSYLSWKVRQNAGSPFRFVELANDVNDHMPHYVVKRAGEVLNLDRKAVNGSRILVLGLAYKAGTGDAREAPGPVICRLLRELGADVRVADPFVLDRAVPPRCLRVELGEDELAGADLVIVVTDHEAFDWALIQRSARRVLDTRHRLGSAEHVEPL